jgi:hypothetical protein
VVIWFRKSTYNYAEILLFFHFRVLYTISNSEEEESFLQRSGRKLSLVAGVEELLRAMLRLRLARACCDAEGLFDIVVY